MDSILFQAYKKLAMQWHPDKFQGEEEKKAAEKKFMDIAAAKEVLTDEGLVAILLKNTYTSLHCIRYIGPMQCSCRCIQISSWIS